MACIDQEVTERYAIFNGDSCEILPTLPSESVHLSIYSPPFATEIGGCLFHYSSSERDLSNCRNYGEFFEHYEFIVKEIARVTMPGRISAVLKRLKKRAMTRPLISSVVSTKTTSFQQSTDTSNEPLSLKPTRPAWKHGQLLRKEHNANRHHHR